MNVHSINFNYLNFVPLRITKPDTLKSDNCSNTQVYAKNSLISDTVSFSGVSNGGDILKRLSAFGVPDMYTGLMLLDPKALESMERNGVFNKPLEKLVKIVSKYEDTMSPADKEFLKILTKFSHKHPNYTLSQTLKEIYPEHKKKLLRAQQPVFEEIMRLACDLPKDLYEEFSELMNITNKRLLNDPVVLPFSEREFLYKLRRIGEDMQYKNNSREMHSMNKLTFIANRIFHNEPKGSRAFGRNIKKKLETQMKPEILKRNSTNLAEFKKFFDVSPLRNNEDIIRLLENTSAKIHGFPAFASFERKSFIHELKKITRNLKNRKYAQQFSEVAEKLPTSKQNVSAFIVKYADEKNNKIGVNMLMNGICSVDHLLARKNGGANRLSNYGLASAEINRRKTNIYFDEWVRKHPETRKNCQKYVDRLIELYKQGYFQKVSKDHKNKKIDKSYIENFAKTIYEISPEENRIVLDISKLYE